MKEGIKETTSRQRPKVHWVPWGRASLPYLLRLLPIFLVGLGIFQAIATPIFLDPGPVLGYGWLGVQFGILGASVALMLSEASHLSRGLEASKSIAPLLAVSAVVLMISPWLLWEEDGLAMFFLFLPLGFTMLFTTFLLQNTRSNYLLASRSKLKISQKGIEGNEIRGIAVIILAIFISSFLPMAGWFYTHERGYETAEWRNEYENGASHFSASGVFQASIALATALCVYATHQGALSTNQRRLAGTLMLSLVIWFLAAPTAIQATGMQGSFRAPLSYLIAALCAWASFEILRVPGVVRRGPGLGGTAR